MSLHTGIEPSKEIDVSELNIPAKKYVDDQDNLKLAKSGGTLTGGLSMDDNKITDLGTPTANTHASTKKYVDDQAALKLDLAGGSMTGPLSLGNMRLWDVANPTGNTNGANKQYVDAQDTALRALCVLKAGSTMSGALNMGGSKITSLGTPTLNTDASTKKYVDERDNLMVLKAGDTMSGALNMGGSKITNLETPTANTDASTKKYVDDKILSVPKESNYFTFQFPSVINNTFKQSSQLQGFLFWTNDRDIKLTILAHVFDDDNALSNLNLYYKVVYWTKAKVKKTNTSIWKTNVNEYVSIDGTWMQSFGIFKSITLTDISCFTLEYKYFHTGNLGNESAAHCLIEYV